MRTLLTICDAPLLPACGRRCCVHALTSSVLDPSRWGKDAPFREYSFLNSSRIPASDKADRVVLGVRGASDGTGAEPTAGDERTVVLDAGSTYSDVAAAMRRSKHPNPYVVDISARSLEVATGAFTPQGGVIPNGFTPDGFTPNGGSHLRLATRPLRSTLPVLAAVLIAALLLAPCSSLLAPCSLLLAPSSMLLAPCLPLTKPTFASDEPDVRAPMRPIATLRGLGERGQECGVQYDHAHGAWGR